MKKIKNPKISFIFKKTLVLSIICGKCNSKVEKIFQEKGSIRILKILGLTNNSTNKYDRKKHKSRI